MKPDRREIVTDTKAETAGNRRETGVSNETSETSYDAEMDAAGHVGHTKSDSGWISGNHGLRELVNNRINVHLLAVGKVMVFHTVIQISDVSAHLTSFTLGPNSFTRSTIAIGASNP